MYKLPDREPKNSARVLTSSENLQILLEKKRQKEEKAEQKQQRKLAREEAKIRKAIEAQKKQQQKTQREQTKRRHGKVNQDKLYTLLMFVSIGVNVCVNMGVLWNADSAKIVDFVKQLVFHLFVLKSIL